VTETRARDIADFLARHGWGEASRAALAGDASFRRYERLTLDGRPAVLMDAPPPMEDVRPFTAIARHLIGLGYSAPRILAEDAERGLLLLEDLGDDLFNRVFETGADEILLYGAAIDLLTDLHRRPPPDDLASHDEAVFLEGVDRLLDWFMPAVLGAPPDDGARAAWRDAWYEVLPHRHVGAPILALRDYHADNLIWLPERSGHARVGLLDFQDALVGSPAYDLVSLLEDVRRDVAPDLVEAMMARYLSAAPDIDPVGFRAAYAVLGGQRNTRIIGTFVRLWQRDGKPGYLDYLPRAWRLLNGDLAHPAMASVRAWFDRHIPPEMRVAPRAPT